MEENAVIIITIIIRSTVIYDRVAFLIIHMLAFIIVCFVVNVSLVLLSSFNMEQ